MGARGVPLGVYRLLRHPSSVVRNRPAATDDYILAPHAPRSHPQLLYRGPYRPRKIDPGRPPHRAHGHAGQAPDARAGARHDGPGARAGHHDQAQRRAHELHELIGAKPEEIFRISAKEGTNVPDLLEAVVRRIPAPRGVADAPLRALIFDSYYDRYRGAIPSIRVVDGTIRPGMKIA